MTFSRLRRRLSFLGLFVLGFFWTIPLVWVFLNSFKTNPEFIKSFTNLKGPLDYASRLWPKQFVVTNYLDILIGAKDLNTVSNMLPMIQNSFIVSISHTLLALTVVSLAAFAYERLDFPGGNAIFWGLMYLSMFPNVVGLLPMFKIASALGWVNNLNALIWPGLSGAFNIFLLRNFLKGVPRALDEAAYIDGASSLQVYRHVILPSIKPVLIVVALFSFNGSWNDFLWPTIVMTDVRRQTLTAGLRLLDGQYGGEWAHLLASVLVSMLPPLLLYLGAQKYFLAGISIQAGVKG